MDFHGIRVYICFARCWCNVTFFLLPLIYPQRYIPNYSQFIHIKNTHYWLAYSKNYLI